MVFFLLQILSKVLLPVHFSFRWRTIYFSFFFFFNSKALISIRFLSVVSSSGPSYSLQLPLVLSHFNTSLYLILILPIIPLQILETPAKSAECLIMGKKQLLQIVCRYVRINYLDNPYSMGGQVTPTPVVGQGRKGQWSSCLHFSMGWCQDLPMCHISNL